MKRQFAVIGCGRFGRSIAKTIYSLGHDVMAVDKSMDVIQSIKDNVTHAVQADVTNEAVIRSLGLNNFDTIIVGIAGDMEASILVTVTAKESGAKYIVAKAQSDIHATVLSKIGADKVVFPESDMGERVAHNVISSNILDYIELSKDYSIVEISCLDSWEGKSLGELDMRRNYGINILAIKHGEKINISPNANVALQSDDILIAIGHIDDLKKIRSQPNIKQNNIT
jgi:trk system potassium uptake protein TrkA